MKIKKIKKYRLLLAVFFTLFLLAIPKVYANEGSIGKNVSDIEFYKPETTKKEDKKEDSKIIDTVKRTLPKTGEQNNGKYIFAGLIILMTMSAIVMVKMKRGGHYEN